MRKKLFAIQILYIILQQNRNGDWNAVRTAYVRNLVYVRSENI